MPNPQCMTDNGDNAQTRAYPVSDARDPRPSSATNGQGLPSGGRGRLKKLVRERGRRMRKVKIATLNVGSMTGRSGEIAVDAKERACKFCAYRRQNGRKVRQERSVPDTNFTITGRIIRGME